MSPRRVVAIALLTFGCGVSAAAAQLPAENPDPAIAGGSAQRKLDDARKSWKDAGLRSYRYEIERSCFCMPQRTRAVTVRGGRPVKFPQGFQEVATIPRVFRRVQRAIDDRVVKLRVSYGPRGVPRSIYIDGSGGIADDEVGYTIRRFTR